MLITYSNTYYTIGVPEVPSAQQTKCKTIDTKIRFNRIIVILKLISFPLSLETLKSMKSYFSGIL